MDEKATALEFLKSHHTGVLASVSRDGTPHASVIYYVTDEHFNIYFLTLFSSRKYKAILERPAVAFTVWTADVPQTVQLEGVAVELKNDDEKREHVADLVKVLTSNPIYYAPITRTNSSEVVIMWIQPKWVRWADYASPDSTGEHILAEIPLD